MQPRRELGTWRIPMVDLVPLWGRVVGYHHHDVEGRTLESNCPSPPRQFSWWLQYLMNVGLPEGPSSEHDGAARAFIRVPPPLPPELHHRVLLQLHPGRGVSCAAALLCSWQQYQVCEAQASGNLVCPPCVAKREWVIKYSLKERGPHGGRELGLQA
eukprot:9484184-Pyramimonas_sp.AAC.1